jgi:dienelactone hydrolase
MKIARFAFFALGAAMFLQAGAAHAAIKTQWIDYKQGDTPLSGYLVYDDAVQGRRPGVLMIHDRSGFSEGTLADAQMIAKLGYVVFGRLLLRRHNRSRAHRNRRAASGFRLGTRRVSEIHAGRRQEHQGTRPDPARRRRSGRADGRTQCRDLAVSRRQGGFRGQPL